jgi:cytidine deaminase
VAQTRRSTKNSSKPDSLLDTELVLAARAVRAQSYSPYSKYAVGAAVRGASRKIYTGVNVENAAYPLTICAERAAIFSAVSQGERSFTAIAVVTANGGTPCGACRQVLAEFHVPTVIVAGGRRRTLVYSLAELLPHSFDARKLPR